MIKLLVQSTLIMDEQQLRDYAYRVPERAKGLSPEKFLEDLNSGQQVIIEYQDKTITAYQIVDNMQ